MVCVARLMLTFLLMAGTVAETPSGFLSQKPPVDNSTAGAVANSTQGSMLQKSPGDNSTLRIEVLSGTQYLAQSWRTDPNQPYLVAPAREIFVPNDDKITTTPFQHVTADEFSSDSAEDFANTISAELDVSGTTGNVNVGQAFTASAHMSLERISTSQKKQYRYDQIIKATIAHLSAKSLSRYKELRPEVRDFLLTADPWQIYQTLGDFYATEIFVGGVFQVTAAIVERVSDTKTSLQSAIRGEMKSLMQSASASLSAGGSVRSTISSRETTVKVHVQGGDPTKWLALSRDNMEVVKAEWASTIDQTNAFPIGFKLTPIWVLLDNPDMDETKAQQLKTYVLNKWAETAGEVPAFPPDTDMPTPAPTRPFKTYNGWYSLENGFSGKFAVVDCWQTFFCRQGTKVLQDDINFLLKDNHKWYIQHVGDGKHTIKTARANLYLGIKGGSIRWSAAAELQGSGGGTWAQWRISCPDAYCSLLNVKSGLWLSLEKFSSSSGVALVQWGVGEPISFSKWKLASV